MTEVISVRFKDKGKVYFFDPVGLSVKTGDHVIVETTKGLEYAECAYGNHMVEDTAVFPPLRPVIRIATGADKKKAEDNKAKEAEAFRICQEKIAKHNMDMKLVDVEYNFEGSKILFFFTSDGRVDFRELVKDLASVFKTRIDLRQIGVRDEARMLGGLGICGRPFCCNQFLDEFHPVSIKMAKTQGLSLNPTKISGTCGRLMCCLKYEQIAYEDLVKKAPKIDAFVDTPSGKGTVMNVNLLRGNAKVRLEDSSDATLKTFVFDDLEILGGKARRAEYIAAKEAGTLEEAGFKPSNIRQPKPVDTRPVAELPDDFPPFELVPIGAYDDTPPAEDGTEAKREIPNPKKNTRNRKSGKGHQQGGSKQAQQSKSTQKQAQQPKKQTEQKSEKPAAKGDGKRQSPHHRPRKTQQNKSSAAQQKQPQSAEHTDQPKKSYRRYHGKRGWTKKDGSKPERQQPAE